MADGEVGKITHYFPTVQVAVLLLSGTLRNGDMIKIVGRNAAFQQQASSMQVDHLQVPSAGPGQSVGLKVIQAVHEGDRVYRLGMDLHKAVI